MTVTAPRYIAFIPGLVGEQSFANRTPDPLPGTYAHAVGTAASELSVPFYRLDFQTAANKFPTLSEMGRELAGNIGLLNWNHEGTGLVVASSIGAGAYLQSLLNMQDDNIEYPLSLLFKPGVDPLLLIAARLKVAGAGHLLEDLLSGKRHELGIPVDPSPQNPQPGNFIITAKHYIDGDAQRIISSDSSRANFWDKFADRKLRELRVLTASNDQMFTAQIADVFAKVMAGCADRYELDLLPGDRADDHGAQLTQAVMAMAGRHGLTRG